jgi:hypothetical protein
MNRDSKSYPFILPKEKTMQKEHYVQIHEMMTNVMSLDPYSVRWDIETILEIYGLYRRHRHGTINVSISKAGWDHLNKKYPTLNLHRRTNFSVWELFNDGYFVLEMADREWYQTIFDMGLDIHFNEVTFEEMGVGESYSKKYEVLHEHGTAEFLSWTGDFAVSLISKLPSNY